jgi:hypothetical protein
MNMLKSLFRFHFVAILALATLSAPVLVTSTTGCANTAKDPRTIAGKSLETVATAVHGAMNTYGILYRAGKVSPEKRTEILAAYASYQQAATLARTALDYDTSRPSTPQVNALADKLIALINQLEN